MDSIGLYIGNEYKTFTVGDEIGIGRGGYDHNLRVCKIAAITPSGQIKLDNGMRFNKYGKQVNKTGIAGFRLANPQTVASRIEQAKTEKNVTDVARHITGIAAYIAANPASEGNAERKMELLRLINSL